jgi:uncharacterized membrane protein
MLQLIIISITVIMVIAAILTLIHVLLWLNPLLPSLFLNNDKNMKNYINSKYLFANIQLSGLT